MSFTRYAEIGRVALINFGPDEGKLCTIVDIVDANRALIDGPFSVTGVHRQAINFRRLALTDLKVKISRNARHKKLAKEWKASNIVATWEASSWAKRLARRQARAAMSDFDRFKAMKAHKKRASAINKKVKATKKAAAKA